MAMKALHGVCHPINAAKALLLQLQHCKHLECKEETQNAATQLPHRTQHKQDQTTMSRKNFRAAKQH